jgi:hypothetical protein
MFTAATLPPAPTGPAAWTGADLAECPEIWLRHWTEAQLEDLLGVVSELTDIDLTELDASAIAPVSTRELAAEIRADLMERHGFTLLRGFPVEELDRWTVATSFLVLGGLVGSPRSQNAAGHLLGHVKDVGADLGEAGTRIYQTNERQTFHTDSADAVALLCIRPAESGGRSMLASAATVYRLVRDRRPDLAARLFDPIATDRRDEQPPGEEPWFEIPVLSWFDGSLTVHYQRTYIDSAARLDRAPSPDTRQIEALDLFDEVLNDPAVHLLMDLEPGDIQFVYNHSLLHDRTAFVDHPHPDNRRHLLRLWLSLPGDRRLPPVFAQRYGTVDVGVRGGIVVADTELCVPLDVR